MGLQKSDAAALLAPGAADHLMQQLEGALAGARVAVAEAQIGIDNADQIELGKMVALGHELRADDDVEATFGHVGEFLLQPLHRFDEIGRQHQDATAGKQFGRFVLQPLDARPDRAQSFRSRGTAGIPPAAAWRSRSDGRPVAA